MNSFLTQLDGKDVYQGGNAITATQIAGVLEYVMHERKLSGVIKVTHLDNGRIALYAEWQDGVDVTPKGQNPMAESGDILQLEVTRGAGMNLAVQHPAVAIMAQHLVDMVGNSNYVETSMTHPDKGEYVMTVQRKNCKTPHELRKQAESKLEAIREILVSTDNYYSSEVDRTVAISAIVNS